MKTNYDDKLDEIILIKRKKKWLHIFLISFLFIFSTLISLVVLWLFNTWPNLKIHEFIFEVLAPLKGTGSDQITKFIKEVIIPLSLITGIVFGIYLLLKSSRKKLFFRRIVVLASIVSLSLSLWRFWKKLEVGNYIKNQVIDSKFIEKNYVDPKNVKLEFPEKKRNLIYISLESMETGYSSKEFGGTKDFNYIPELTKLSLENENFSSNNSVLNGGVSLTGTGWTMGGLFAQTSGLPLKITIDGNMMGNQTDFFPEITTLGDILLEEGYNNYFMLGSDADFGGRSLYYQSHGNYELNDYKYAKSEGYIPKTYKVFWGMEDHKLFDMTKARLNDISNNGKPFNVHILTVDTHFEDGYVDAETPHVNDNEQYGNDIYGSDRRVNEFINWCKGQPWYENTTIVISGDHPTMDKDFMMGVDSNHNRKVYFSIINGAGVREEDTVNRYYSTIDNFPTTLAALGVKIPGDKLALGVNLYSKEKTLVEQFGEDYLNEEFARRSKFMEKLASLDTTSDRYKALSNPHHDQIQVEEIENKVHVKLDYFLENKDSKLPNRVHLFFGSENPIECQLEVDNQGNTYFEVDKDLLGDNIVKLVFGYSKEKENPIFLTSHGGFLSLLSNQFENFTDQLAKLNLEKFEWFCIPKGEYWSELSSDKINRLINLGVSGDILTNQQQFIFSTTHEMVSDYEITKIQEDNLDIEASEESHFILDGVSQDLQNGINFVVRNKETGSIMVRNFNTVDGYPEFTEQSVEQKGNKLVVNLSGYTGIEGEVFGTFLVVQDKDKYETYYFDKKNSTWKMTYPLKNKNRNDLRAKLFVNKGGTILSLGEFNLKE